MSEASSQQYLLVGKVIRPHGLDGVMRIVSYAESENTFLAAETVFIESGGGERRAYKVQSIKPHKNVYLLQVEGVNSIEEAETCRNAPVFIQKASLDGGDEDEYFWFELLGLDVFLDSGKHLGKIRQLVPTGGHDVYVVTKGSREVLVPAVHDFVEEIDLENRRMIIKNGEGLLDLNEV